MGINRSAQGGGHVATEPGPLGPTPAFLGTTPVLLQLLGGGGGGVDVSPPPPNTSRPGGGLPVKRGTQTSIPGQPVDSPWNYRDRAGGRRGETEFRNLKVGFFAM